MLYTNEYVLFNHVVKNIRWNNRQRDYSPAFPNLFRDFFVF